jgi:hypothetical protein
MKKNNSLKYLLTFRAQARSLAREAYSIFKLSDLIKRGVSVLTPLQVILRPLAKNCVLLSKEEIEEFSLSKKKLVDMEKTINQWLQSRAPSDNGPLSIKNVAIHHWSPTLAQQRFTSFNNIKKHEKVNYPLRLLILFHYITASASRYNWFTFNKMLSLPFNLCFPPKICIIL